MIGYVLMLLTCIFMDVLTLICSVLVMKGTSKFSVENRANHGMGCLHVNIDCI